MIIGSQLVEKLQDSISNARLNWPFSMFNNQRSVSSMWKVILKNFFADSALSTLQTLVSIKLAEF